VQPPVAAVQPPVAAVQPPVAAVQPPVAAVQPVLSDIDMNNILVTEFKRINAREPIDAIMASLGVTSVAGLSSDKQQQLIDAVRAITA